MKRHRIKFRYGGDEDDQALDMAFSKKKIEERKTWLTNWMAVRYLPLKNENCAELITLEI